MKGRVGGALLSVYTRAVRFLRAGIPVSSVAAPCRSTVTRRFLPALSPGRPCPLLAERRLLTCSASPNHLESSDALFNKNLGQTVKDAIFLLLHYD